jgi:hypothetical protein
MGYFDGLFSSKFRTTADGQTLFYPFGPIGRAYKVGSAERVRLLWQIKAWFVFGIGIGIAAFHFEYPIGVILMAAWCVGYLGWTLYVPRNMQPSDKQPSLRERVAARARAYGPAALWMVEIIAILFVVGGLFILSVSPAKDWLLVIPPIIFFGAGAIAFGFMLAVRRRA